MAVPGSGGRAVDVHAGPIGFLTPWLLTALVALPILWILLGRCRRRRSGGGFRAWRCFWAARDDDAETDKTPWWLLLLRMLAVAAAIVGFAGPVLNPEQKQAGSGPLLVVLDGGWAEARDWARRVERAGQLVAEAGAAGRTVAVIRLTDRPQEVLFQTAEPQAARLAGMEPAPYAPGAMEDWAEVLPAESFDTIWLSDGLAHEGREALAAVFQDKGDLTVIESPRPVFALHPRGSRTAR